MEQESEAYDRSVLYSRLREVVSLAGELRYVDAVLAFIAAENQIGSISQGPRPDFVTVSDIGRTYPFSRIIRKQPMPRNFETTVENFLEGAAEEARAWRDTNFESMLRTIEPITHPDISYYDEIVRRLQVSHSILTAESESGAPPDDTFAIRRGEFGLMNPEAWAGTAATNFRDNFYRPFESDVRGYQADYTRSIAAGFVRAKAIDGLAQISLQDAVTATRDDLLEQLQHRQQETRGYSKSEILTIASTGTAILAGITAPAPLVSISMGTIAGYLNYAASEEAAEERAREKESIEGESADDLYFGLYDLVRAIDNRRRGHYETLDLDMSKLLEWADSQHRENVLIPMRPDIAERDDGALAPDTERFLHKDPEPMEG